MEKGRLTDCIDMRYHTKGLIKDTPILRALGEQDTAKAKNDKSKVVYCKADNNVYFKLLGVIVEKHNVFL